MRNLPKTEFGDTVHIICRGTARRALRFSLLKFHNLDCHSRATGNPGKAVQNLCICVIYPKRSSGIPFTSFVGARRAVPLRFSLLKFHNLDCHSRANGNPGKPEQNL